MVVSDLRQVGVFPGTPVSSTNNTTHRHDIPVIEIVLRVSLNTLTLTLTLNLDECFVYVCNFVIFRWVYIWQA